MGTLREQRSAFSVVKRLATQEVGHEERPGRHHGPCRAPHGDAEASAGAGDGEQQVSEQGTGVISKKVLIADDHPPTVTMIREVLEAAGYAVVTAANGPECLLAVEREQPDLVILDVIMPIMDGVKTLQVLRANQETKDLPVIILSIKGKGADISAGLAAGADLYFTKPFDLEQLVATVKRVLETE
jgi:two-component system alkaline phosphatase synthesis response regulator PhoP